MRGSGSRLAQRLGTAKSQDQSVSRDLGNSLHKALNPQPSAHRASGAQPITTQHSAPKASPSQPLKRRECEKCRKQAEGNLRFPCGREVRLCLVCTQTFAHLLAAKLEEGGQSKKAKVQVHHLKAGQRGAEGLRVSEQKAVEESKGSGGEGLRGLGGEARAPSTPQHPKGLKTDGDLTAQVPSGSNSGQSLNPPATQLGKVELQIPQPSRTSRSDEADSPSNAQGPSAQVQEEIQSPNLRGSVRSSSDAATLSPSVHSPSAPVERKSVDNTQVADRFGRAGSRPKAVNQHSALSPAKGSAVQRFKYVAGNDLTPDTGKWHISFEEGHRDSSTHYTLSPAHVHPSPREGEVAVGPGDVSMGRVPSFGATRVPRHIHTIPSPAGQAQEELGRRSSGSALTAFGPDGFSAQSQASPSSRVAIVLNQVKAEEDDKAGRTLSNASTASHNSDGLPELRGLGVNGSPLARSVEAKGLESFGVRTKPPSPLGRKTYTSRPLSSGGTSPVGRQRGTLQANANGVKQPQFASWPQRTSSVRSSPGPKQRVKT